MPRKGEKMNRIINQGSRVWKKAILVMAILAWCIGSSPAAEAPEVLQINPVPDLQAAETLTIGDKDIVIHGYGQINRIGEDDMLIDDLRMWISPSVEYYSRSNGLPAFQDEFSVGTFIGFRINEKREIIELWLIKDKQ